MVENKQRRSFWESSEPKVRPADSVFGRRWESGTAGSEQGNEPFKPCGRCGLRPAEAYGKCDSCRAELDFCSDKSTPICVTRPCPVCKGDMQHAPDFHSAPRYVCTCGAVFDVATAQLSFPGCTRVGKGVRGTNAKVRNDARKLRRSPEPSLEERHERELAEQTKLARAQEERRLAAEGNQLIAYYRHHREIPTEATPEAIAQALIRCGDEELRRRSFEILYRGKHIEELQKVAASKCRYKSRAQAALAQLGGTGRAE